MVTKPVWKGLWLALLVLVWLASAAGATRGDILRVLLTMLPWLENPWVWVTGLTVSTAIISIELTAWCLRRSIVRVEMSVNREPMLFDEPQHIRSTRKWVHTIAIRNSGTKDIDANCLVKLDTAWNEVGHSLAWLPFALRPINQIREGRNQPFNLRRGEPKNLVVGFSFTLAGERNWVDFVDGTIEHRVTFDSFLTRWLVVRAVAFGGGLPCYATGVFTLKDRQFTFRPRRSYEALTKSWAVAKVRWAYRRYGVPAAKWVRQRWRTAWPRIKGAALAGVASLSQSTRRLLRAVSFK